MVTRNNVRGWESKLVIDVDDLDTCLAEQPDLTYHVGEAYADAADRRDTLKLELEELMSEVEDTVRQQFADDGVKPTESAVKSRVAQHGTVGTLRRKMQVAEREVRRTSNLKEGFTQRSYMLRELVTLTIDERRDRAGAAGAYEAQERVSAKHRAAAGRVRRPRAGGS